MSSNRCLAKAVILVNAPVKFHLMSGNISARGGNFIACIAAGWKVSKIWAAAGNEHKVPLFLSF